LAARTALRSNAALLMKLLHWLFLLAFSID
jgi:hypothetical protein